MPATQPPRYFRRYRGYDYTRGASLFITIVTEPRSALFGRVMNAAVELSPLGQVVAESLQSMPQRVPGVALYGWVVMPDHIHLSYLEAIRDQRVLIMAKGNEEVPFSRALCEELNGDVVDIAFAGQGLAVYWTPEGAQRLSPAPKTAHSP